MEFEKFFEELQQRGMYVQSLLKFSTNHNYTPQYLKNIY